MDFQSHWQSTENLMKSAYWFFFSKGELLVQETGGTSMIPLLLNRQAAALSPDNVQYIGSLQGRDCYAASLPPQSAPEGFSYRNLRSLYGQLGDAYFGLAARSFHILNWKRNNTYCGRCGKPMNALAQELAMNCPHCGNIVYPRISPAIIIAVTKGDQLLLACSNRLKVNRYSVIAGFVEPGETLIDCARRELREEVGIQVKNVTYFGSQPWPFPDSLMIAFTAEYAGGEITIDNKEILAAGWFTADHFPPNLPGRESIASRLIDWFAEKNYMPNTARQQSR